jgi:hypothetical protein
MAGVPTEQRQSFRYMRQPQAQKEISLWPSALVTAAGDGWPLQQALLFEKRSENSCLSNRSGWAALTHYKKKFVGSFSKKNCLLSSPRRTPGSDQA